jgi:catechol 2,3-dioxygenase
MQDSPGQAAHLHHVRFGCADTARVADYYRRVMQMRCQPLGDGMIDCSARQRRIVLQPGTANTLVRATFAFQHGAGLEALRERARQHGVRVLDAHDELLGPVLRSSDPDGNVFDFGIAVAEPAISGNERLLPGRLQHVVVATTDTAPMIRFHTEVLGFVPSDIVRDARGRITACFLRSDHEHHSFAIFLADRVRPDHCCLETTCWNDLRDWADHASANNAAIHWGPGRHGPGNNLFLMLQDPEGNWLEISAELQVVTPGSEAGNWPHAPRTLNRWGETRMRI